MSTTIETIKSLAARLSPPAILRRLNFMPTLTSGGGNFGASTAGNLSAYHAFTSNGGAFDTDVTQGDVLDNSVVAACVNAIAQALPEAPILLEKRVGGNEFERVDSHPVLDLLHNPNPYLSEAELWGITTAFERTRGEAFWYFEYEQGGSVPKEIWFRAPEFVQTLSDAENFISGYNIMAESGKMVALGEGDVVHFRHQLNTRNPRAGWTPLQTGRRQIVGDNSAAVYHSAILRNAGAASLIISLKDAAAAGEVTPGQLDEYVQQFKRKSSGAGAGAILGMDLPLDVHKVGYSPDEMSIDKLLNNFESRLCALLGVNRRVINLGQDPTYENSRVALKDFWQRTIIPMRRRHAAILSSQLLPLFGLAPSQYRLSFDFSEVEALREDVDALHARWRATFTAGGIDLYTFQEKIGLAPDEAYRGRYAKPSSPLDGGEGGDEIKDVTRGKTTSNPHNTAGSFARGGGSARALPVQSVSGVVSGSGSSSSSSTSSSGSVSGALAQLHGQHGVGSRTGIFGSRDGKRGTKKRVKPDPREHVGLQLGVLSDMIGNVHDLEWKHLSAEVVRNRLTEMYEEPRYKILRERIYKNFTKWRDVCNRLDRDKTNPILRDEKDYYKALLGPDLDEIDELHAQRYPEMWGMLVANDEAQFNEWDFHKIATFTPDEDEKMRKGIDFMARMIDNEAFPFPKLGLSFDYVQDKKERTHYVPYDPDDPLSNTIFWDKQLKIEDVVHEMAHWLIDHNPKIEELLKSHYEARTKGQLPRPLSEIDPGYKHHEQYKLDKFLTEYMGTYAEEPDGSISGNNEILSVGLQCFVVAPDYLAAKDPMTFDFIYKLLRGETPEIDPRNYKSVEHLCR